MGAKFSKRISSRFRLGPFSDNNEDGHQELQQQEGTNSSNIYYSGLTSLIIIIYILPLLY